MEIKYSYVCGKYSAVMKVILPEQGVNCIFSMCYFVLCMHIIIMRM